LVKLLKSDVVKIKILAILSDKNAHSTNELATKCRINAITVHRNCLFLSQLGFLTVTFDKAKHVKAYEITLEGSNAAELLAKSQLDYINTPQGNRLGPRR
jgi:DNA-binding transcriptional regulator YhcF (GntR family)